MLLPDWKNIGMWVFDKEGVTAPSKYNTKDLIIKRLSECKVPWNSYFEMHFEEEGEVIKFKARKIREKLWEPIYVDETEVVVDNISGIRKISI